MAGKTASVKAKKQQSTAAATESTADLQGKQNAPATEFPQEQALRQSPRKHHVSPGLLPRSKRAKTHETAETTSVGEVHPYAFVDEGSIEDPEKEGDPTC